jgi:hypothetical protein
MLTERLKKKGSDRMQCTQLIRVRRYCTFGLVYTKVQRVIVHCMNEDGSGMVTGKRIPKAFPASACGQETDRAGTVEKAENFRTTFTWDSLVCALKLRNITILLRLVTCMGRRKDMHMWCLSLVT